MNWSTLYHDILNRRIKDDKEREVQRLREMQEKANDRQSELDALRAKRAMELNERQARAKEAREAAQKVHTTCQQLDPTQFWFAGRSSDSAGREAGTCVRTSHGGAWWVPAHPCTLARGSWVGDQIGIGMCARTTQLINNRRRNTSSRSMPSSWRSR